MSHTQTTTPSITPPKPFPIRFPQSDLDQFKRKLEDARLPHDPLFPRPSDSTTARTEGSGRQGLEEVGQGPVRGEGLASSSHTVDAGVIQDDRGSEFEPLSYPSLEMMSKTIEYWKRMDLKALEKKLDGYPNFTTSIDWCEQLHFLHQPSSRKDAIPLLLCHGWPGSSIMEFGHLMHRLAEPEDESRTAFHVVAPSMPGFLWSSPPPRKGGGVGDVDGYCRLFNALMIGLGYETYAVQGGDWGSIHARTVASKFAKPNGGCVACHLNFLPVMPAPLPKLTGPVLLSLPESTSLSLGRWIMSAEEQKALKKTLLYVHHGSTYYKVQQSRPSQLGFGCIDSPVALLGWLAYFTSALDVNFESSAKSDAKSKREGDHAAVEVFVAAKDGSQGGAAKGQPWRDQSLDVDWLLSETFLYWLTRSAATSFLPYSTNRFLLEYIVDPAYRVDVPMGYSGFPREIIDCPLSWARKYGNVNLTWYNQSPVGGHLASTEQPEIFAQHLRAAFARGGQDEFSRDSSNWGEEGEKDKTFVEGKHWKKAGLWDQQWDKGWPTGA